MHAKACSDYLSPGLRFSSCVQRFPSLSGPQLKRWVGEAEAQEWDQVDYWNISSWVPGEKSKNSQAVAKIFNYFLILQQRYVKQPERRVGVKCALPLDFS